MTAKIGFIGAGNMGGALLRSIAANGAPGKFQLLAYDIHTPLVDALSKEIGVLAVKSAAELVAASDVVVLAVKPQYSESVLNEIKSTFLPGKVLVTIIVGVPISYYKNILGEEAKIVRTMPNTPALVGAGMTLVCADSSVSQEEKALVMELMSCCGLAEELEERLMNEVTALTGSSPAYIYMLIEAMADAAVQSGLPRKLSYRLAAQAVMGSAKMVLETGTHPGELKDMVCSPAGTTIEAVAVLEKEGFRHSILAAMDACTQKAREIGRRFKS